MLVARSVLEEAFSPETNPYQLHGEAGTRTFGTKRGQGVKDVDVFSYRALPQEHETTKSKIEREDGNHLPESISQRQKDKP